MKQLILKIVLVFALISCATHKKAPKHFVQVKIPAMVCQVCVHNIKSVFKSKVENTETDVEINLKTKIVSLKLLEKLSDEEIRTLVETDTEYKVLEIKRP
ncbi:MAG: hypothetical protein ACPGJV_14005 [Bacteriovoracaceae bacterium]